MLAITAVPALGASAGNWYGPIAGLVIIAFGTGDDDFDGGVGNDDQDS